MQTKKNVQSKELSLQSLTILMTTYVFFLFFFILLFTLNMCVYVMLMMMTLFIPSLQCAISSWRKKVQLQSTQVHRTMHQMCAFIDLNVWMNEHHKINCGECEGCPLFFPVFVFMCDAHTKASSSGI